MTTKITMIYESMIYSTERRHCRIYHEVWLPVGTIDSIRPLDKKCIFFQKYTTRLRVPSERYGNGLKDLLQSVRSNSNKQIVTYITCIYS